MPATDEQFSTHIAYGLPYWFYLPADYETETEKTYPVILFLHGAGERGSDLSIVKNVGLPPYVRSQEDFPFIVIAPQCPLDHWWSQYSDPLIALLNKVMANYRVDPQRVYLTGLSMGGFGAWYLATEYPERFAAIAPVCGFSVRLLGFPDRLQRITHVPVWNFHGAVDSVVPVSESDFLVNTLKRYGGNVLYTVYPDVDHDAWTPTYRNPDLYAWFLQHTITPSVPE